MIIMMSARTTKLWSAGAVPLPHELRPRAPSTLMSSPIHEAEHDEEMAKHVAESRLLLAQRLAEEGDAAAARLAFESVLAVSTDADVTAQAEAALAGHGAVHHAAMHRTATVPTVALDGWLDCREGAKPTLLGVKAPEEWRRGYVVLQRQAAQVAVKAKTRSVGDERGSLAEYESGEAFDAGELPLRAVPLMEARIAPHPDPDFGWTLRVRTKDHCWELRAGSVEERDRWVTAAAKMQSDRAPPPPSSAPAAAQCLPRDLPTRLQISRSLPGRSCRSG